VYPALGFSSTLSPEGKRMINLFHLLRGAKSVRLLLLGVEVGEPMCARNGVASSASSRCCVLGRLFWLNFLWSARIAGLFFSHLP
jgi:hypothetical protein